MPGDFAQLVGLSSTVGVTTVVTLYFVWWVTNQLSKKLDVIADKLDDIIQREERILGRLNGCKPHED